MRVSLKNFFRKLLTGGVLVAATLGGAAASHGAMTLTDGGFETPNVGGSYGSYGGTAIGGVKWTPHNMYPGGYTNGNLNIFAEELVPTGGMATGTMVGDVLVTQYMAATHLGDFGPDFSNFSGSVGNAPTGLYIDQTLGRITGADTTRTFTLSADLIRAMGQFWGMGPSSYANCGITIGFINGTTGQILAQNSITYGADYVEDYSNAFKSTVSLDWNAAGMTKGTIIKAFVGFTIDNTTVVGVDGDTASVDNVVLTPSVPYPNVPTLTWRGTGSTAQWSLASSPKNWTDGSTSVAYTEDSPTVFDDYATSAPTVEVVEDIVPGSVTFNNDTKNYFLTGSKSVLGMDLIKTGNAKLTITNNNDFLGSVTISGGTLQVGNGGATGALGPAPIVNDASLVFKRSDTVVLNNDVSGTGSLTQDGTGTLQLVNHYTYAGGTIVNSGILELAPSYDNGSGTIRGTLTINAGATVRQTNSNTLGWWGSSHVDTVNINGGTLDNNNLSQHFWNCALNMTGGNILVGGPEGIQVGGGSNTVFTINSFSSTATISGNGYLVLREDLPSNTLACNVADGSQPIDFSITNIRGNGRTITKSGDGTMDMTGALNNSDLKVIVNGGTLLLNKASVPDTVTALGASHATGLTVNPSTTVKLAGTGGDQIYTQTGVALNNGTLDFNGRNEGFWSISGNGTVTNTAAGTTSVMTVGETSDSLNYSSFTGAIQNGAGTMGFVKTGGSMLYLDGINNFTGGTTVNGGTLIIRAANTALGAIQVSGGATLQADLSAGTSVIPAASSVTLANGTLSVLGDNYNALTQAINGLTLAAYSANTVSVVNDSGSGLTVNLGAITRNSYSTLNVTLPVAGSVRTTSGTANQVLKDATTGAAYATVNGLNWAAKDSANSAIVAYSSYVNNTWAAGNNTTVTANNTQTGATTGTLRFGASSGSTGYTVTLSGTNTIASGILVTPYANSGYGSAITGGSLSGVAGGELIIHQFNELSEFTISSTIVNPSTGSTLLFKTGLGTLALNPTANNTYSGGTVVGMGTLTLNRADCTNAGTGTLQINTGATVNATVDNAFGLASGGSLTPVWVNGGALNLAYNNDLNSVTLTGGLIPESNTLYGSGMNMQPLGATAPSIKSLASSTTSQILAKITMNSDLTINCENGTAAIDLEIPRIDLITGDYSIHKTGSGTLKIGSGWQLGGDPTRAVAGWTGDTVVDAGKLVINSGNWYATPDANATGRSLIINANGEAETVAPHAWSPSGLGAIVINGGKLTITSEFYNPPVTMTGGLIQGPSELRLGNAIATKASADSAVISAPVASVWGTATFDVEDGVAATDLLVSGTIRGAAVTKTGAGLLAFSAANTYTGLTTVSGGTLELLPGGSLLAGNNVATETGAIFKIDAGDNVLGTITGTGTTELVSGSLTLTSITQDSFVNDGAITITASEGTINTISGGGSLTVQSGVLSATSITQGTLTIGNTFVTAAVPEPSTIVLLVLAGLGVTTAFFRRK